MAVKGAKAKSEITKIILETFSGSFINDKEIRIPFTEDGTELQVKVVLTAAKDIVENGAANAIPGEPVAQENKSKFPPTTPKILSEPKVPTDEEKAKVAMLFERLGL